MDSREERVDGELEVHRHRAVQEPLVPEALDGLEEALVRGEPLEYQIDLTPGELAEDCVVLRRRLGEPKRECECDEVHRHIERPCGRSVQWRRI